MLSDPESIDAAPESWSHATLLRATPDNRTASFDSEANGRLWMNDGGGSANRVFGKTR
jgi:hypothetical protein